MQYHTAHAMQIQLADAALFIRITELGSLSAAARERDAPVSQVTRALVRLEASCGLRLLHRSTHGLSLTDEGDTFLAYARRLVDTAAELASELGDRRAGPSGWVRISVSSLLAETVIAPGLAGLYARHPQLHLDICADDRLADMARDGIDIAIRTGKPASDTVVARQIGSHGRGLYAAPAYLAQRGTPQHPDELAKHHLLASSVTPALNRWPLEPAPEALLVRGQTRTDNTAVMMALAQHGVGIARLNDLLARPLVQSGALVPVLPRHFASTPTPIYAVMLPERQRLPKIRACTDYWAEWLATLAKDSPP
jgi:DNA-binding transcriptional LysR family regulator